ncbi:MAG: hypothetical protein H0T49_01170 [Chloroflexia bacterium]|nr:hypothetical protein [Chloroflexia bacterium]
MTGQTFPKLTSNIASAAASFSGTQQARRFRGVERSSDRGERRRLYVVDRLSDLIARGRARLPHLIEHLMGLVAPKVSLVI